MGLFAIVAYHPREGMEAELREAIRDHLEVLGAEGLVTPRAPYVMRSQDGTYLEVFEWNLALRARLVALRASSLRLISKARLANEWLDQI
jgi:hypothetical protein